MWGLRILPGPNGPCEAQRGKDLQGSPGLKKAHSDCRTKKNEFVELGSPKLTRDQNGLFYLVDLVELTALTGVQRDMWAQQD